MDITIVGWVWLGILIGIPIGLIVSVFLTQSKINDLESWDESSLDKLLLQYREEHELSVPKVNQPIRIALTGSTNSPSLGLTLYLFDKKEVLKRLDQLIKHLHTKN